MSSPLPPTNLWLYENRQTKYVPTGRDAADADAERKKLEKSPSKTAAKSAAYGAGGTFVDKVHRQTLARTAAAYNRDAEQHGTREAAGQARLVSEEFKKLLNNKDIRGGNHARGHLPVPHCDSQARVF